MKSTAHIKKQEETNPKALPVLTPPSKLMERFNISRSTGFRLEADPNSGFPKRIHVFPGGKLTAWLTEELEAYFNNQPRVRASSIK